MPHVVSFEEQMDIPVDVAHLADVRRWVRSASFPERGRIDHLGGRMVDLSPGDFCCHGAMKAELVMALNQWIQSRRQGHLPEFDAQVMDEKDLA